MLGQAADVVAFSSPKAIAFNSPEPHRAAERIFTVPDPRVGIISGPGVGDIGYDFGGDAVPSREKARYPIVISYDVLRDRKHLFQDWVP